MTFQAEIVCLAARKGFQHVIGVWRLVRIMAFDAVALSRRMQRTLADNGLSVFMTLKAEGNDCGGFKIDASDIPGDTNLMAGKTTNSDGRMNRFPLGLFFMTLQAFGSIRILLKSSGMLASLKGYNATGRP
jgi:hypothetical protein